MTRVRHNVITGPAIGTFDSNIWIIDSDIRAVYSSGQSVSPYLGGASFLGGPRNGTAWIIGSRIEGGIDHPNGNTAMDPGIYAVYCDLFITGGSTILGADYSVPTLACPGNPGSTRHWSVLQSSPSPPDPRATWFVRDPNTTLDDCHIVEGHDLVREFPAVLPGEAIRGQQQSIVAYGATGSIVSVFASFVHGAEPVHLSIGDVWLDPGLVVEIGSAAVGPDRRATLTTTIPAWLQLGDVLVYQAACLSQPSTWEISQPGFAVVRDP
ncbi:MAG: hypothetical protein IPM29_15745 [Planctomycetes bacterium]|nr:hypothetical protein [Planctomycetota bacterium]